MCPVRKPVINPSLLKLLVQIDEMSGAGDTGGLVTPASESNGSEHPMQSTPRTPPINKHELLVKELKIIFTYCFIPIPLALIWSLVVGGFANYDKYIIPFTGVAFELFAIVFMVYKEDYPSLNIKSPDPSANANATGRSTTGAIVESKYVILYRAFAALTIFMGTFMLVVQLANWTMGAKTIDGKENPQPAIIWIMDNERRLHVLLPFLQIGVAACLAFVRVFINLGVLLVHTFDVLKYPILGLLIHHYFSHFIAPIFSEN